MDETRDYTVNHTQLVNMYPIFGDTILPPAKTLGQFNHVTSRFLIGYESEGAIKTNMGYLGDNDNTELISSVSFDNQMDYDRFMDYLQTHVAVSLKPEERDGLKGLEEVVLGLQKKHNAAGPFTVERTTVPPVLFKVPEGHESDIDHFANSLRKEITSVLPGVDVILSYTQPNDTRYC